jgi:DHA2 family multidrug resistance protein
VLIFLVGFVLYIQVSMLPLLYQEVLGYTALTAGIVVAPRGFGAMMGLPIVGKLSQHIDNRWLLFVGFIVFTISSLLFSFINMQIGPGTLLIAIVVAGFGMSFLFVPLGNMGTATVPNPEIGNATGIFNLLRNIGGSVGISLAQTELVRRAAFHQTHLAAAVPQSGYVFQMYSNQLSHYLARHMGHAAGYPLALGHLYRMLQQQALLLSFLDIFRWCALITAVAAALGWLFRKVKIHHDGMPD